MGPISVLSHGGREFNSLFVKHGDSLTNNVGREGGLVKGTSLEGTGRDMDSGREEVRRGGIERGREGARE